MKSHGLGKSKRNFISERIFIKRYSEGLRVQWRPCGPGFGRVTSDGVKLTTRSLSGTPSSLLAPEH